ncbi:MAG TPA: DJ-1/PfpI family protein [Steroidobacteraceae bacterium]|nr:DJ-1/PfpI family protein [Steroidobacteraceae bacterium]
MKRIVMLCVPPAQGLDVIGPLDVFAIANRMIAASSGAPPYEIELVTSAKGLEIATSSGVKLVAHRHYRQVRGEIDTLLIAGGPGARHLDDPALLEWLRKAAARARRVCSICTGARLLAAAGLLQGRRATTHWRFVDSFARSHPSVAWDPDPIWVRDGRFYTSAGISAGMDLAIALIEEDAGSAVALDVARHMVMFLRRPGSQAQFSVALAAQATERRVLQELQAWIAENLARDLGVEALAVRAAMSARNFARVFTRELGTTPARYVEQARIEAARTQLESSGDGVERIARRCGFSSAELLRRAFVRHLNVSPSRYREHFRTRRLPRRRAAA